jgi:hypothetical protein
MSRPSTTQLLILAALAALPSSCRRGGGATAADETTPLVDASATDAAPPAEEAVEPGDAGTTTPGSLGATAAAPGAEVTGITTMEQLVALAEAFGRPEFGVVEAQAVLGAIERSQPVRSEGFEDFELRTAPGLVRTVLETKRGELIGIQLDFGPEPLDIRPQELGQTWGEPRPGPAPLDSMLPSMLVYAPRTERYELQLMLQPAEPPAAGTTRLRDAVLRRFPVEELVPERWSTAEDLAALFRLVFRDGALEPVTLYGSLGVFAGRTGDGISLTGVDARNVAEGRLVVGPGPGGFEEVVEAHMRFVEPLAVDPPRLAEASHARLESGPDGPRLVLERGRVELRLDAAGKLTGLACHRTLVAAP